ncbi:Glutamate decarboxylase [Curvularia clavata]|uniref:Glutamate decarboxylase n=1 Tax=Curvularia clavata TaxID=95742 RepID=A0A9Q8ZBX2_CURCL|nr:Glutamate decarboxylase [Curvularia clavata]
MAMPMSGVPAEAARGIVNSFLDEDLDPKLNLATFSTTSFHDLPVELLCETLRKNMSNQHEYNGVTNIHRECAKILAALWNGGEDGERPVGNATTGSSEALMLGCLAMKKQWLRRKREEGANTSQPNIIFSSIAHVVCAKFSQYFDVEARILPVTQETGYVMNTRDAVAMADENTIGVVAVLGSTYTGHYEPVQQLSSALDELHSNKGLDIPIHVDAASGGLVAPFVQSHLTWDFKLKRVNSINTSSHKFGQVPTSLGWIVWRDKSYIPQEMIFDVEYLDQIYQSWTMSFSKPSFQVVLQYYNFVRNGFDGSAEIIRDCMTRARDLSITLEDSGRFKCITSIPRCEETKQITSGILTPDSFHIRQSVYRHTPDGFETNDQIQDYFPGLPVVAFNFSESFLYSNPRAQLYVISESLRNLGYSVPCRWIAAKICK